MELTKRWIEECIGGYVTFTRGYKTATDEIWEALQEDRQRVRDEAIDEVKRDHYAVGEKVELLADFWEPIVFGFQDKHGNFVDDVSNGSFHFRRPPKTRPMTREEKIEALYNLNRPITLFGRSYLEKLSDQTLDELMAVDCLSTEVPE